jgi:hypothetical protein
LRVMSFEYIKRYITVQNGTNVPVPHGTYRYTLL